MENLLFDSYRVFQKEYNGNIIRRFFKLPLGATILFFLAMTSVIGATVFTVWEKQGLCLACLGVEIVTGVAMFFYTENYQLKTVDKRLITYRNYCADVHAWLSRTGFLVTPQNIEEFLVRVNRQIEQQENIAIKKNEHIRHIVDVVLIPFLLAIFSLWMTGKTELAVLVTGALAIFTAVGFFGMIAYFIYSALSFSRKRKLEQWRCFADDLQGVLDTQFVSKMITEPPLRETKIADAGPRPSAKKKKAKNAGQPWTKDDDALLCEMYDAGLSKKDIAKHFMRSNNAIAARLVKLGKIPNRSSF